MAGLPDSSSGAQGNFQLDRSFQRMFPLFLIASTHTAMREFILGLC
jgi:hypothetical protein